MEIRLVAVDLDGTLLNNDKTLSAVTVRAVARAVARGVEVVLATGRTYREFSHLLRLLPGVRYAVSCTGASVLDCRIPEELFSSPLPAELVREAWRRLRGYDVLFEVFQDGMIFVDQRLDAQRYMEKTCNPAPPGTRAPKAAFDGWLETQQKPMTKIHMFFRDTAERDRAWEAVRDLDAFVCCSDAYDLEIMAPGVHKGTGLAQLAEYLDLRPEQILAVGDGGNDLAMLEYAGVKAVVGNAAPELKAVADIVTDTNEHDGVAALLDWLIGEEAASSGCLH